MKCGSAVDLALYGLHMGIWHYSPDDGHVCLSEGVMAMLGAPSEKLPLSALLELFETEDAKKLEEMLTSPPPGEDGFDLTLRYGSEEHYGWCRLRGRAQMDAAEPPALLAGTITNLTPSEQEGFGLSHGRTGLGEDNYRLLVENANEAIIVLQGDKVEYANPRSSELTGFTNQELKEKPFLEFVHPDDQQLVQLNYSRRLRGQPVPNYYSFKIFDATGEVRIAEVNAVPVFWKGQPATLNFLNDITERKRADEELRRAFQLEKQLGLLRSTFITMASHQFRTPLTAILSSTEILERYTARTEDERADKHLKRIREKITEMMSLLETMLAIGSARARGAELMMERIDLRKFCIDKAAEFRLLLEEESKVTLLLDCPETETPVRFSGHLIGIALENLLDNARKFSPEGGEIRLQAGVGENEVFFIVSDQGIGVPAHETDNIFNPFYRAENAEGYPGPGLGLTLVKEAVSSHEGVIAAKLNEGGGLTVTIRIPLYD